ncbi:MAG: hypothetical protein AABZ08_02875 [Planctomycetota bacterium]
MPDQAFTGCFEVSIVRTFNSDAERELIQRAEDLASTVGPTWVSTTQTPGLADADGNPAFLIADAVTSEDLAYYANRILTFQTSANRGTTRFYLSYTAHIIDKLVGTDPLTAKHRTIVRLQQGYSEWYGPLAASGPDAWREVEFDEAGEVVEVRGDGETVVFVS